MTGNITKLIVTKPNEKLCYLKYCTIGNLTASLIDFSYKSIQYTLNFDDKRFKEKTGFSIVRNDGKHIEISLLRWLSLFLVRFFPAVSIPACGKNRLKTLIPVNTPIALCV
jgi:hypothetical protein